MIQDIQPKVYDNAFRQKAPDEESLILFIKDYAVLVKETEDGIAFPRYGELEPHGTLYTYLFSIDRTTFFLCARMSGATGRLRVPRHNGVPEQAP